MDLKQIAYKVLNIKPKQTSMKNAKLSAILGRDVAMGEALSAEDMEKITASIPDPGTTEEVVATTELVAEESATMAAIQSLTETVAALSQSVTAGISAVNARIDGLESTPGTTTATTAPVNGTEDKGKKEVPSWEDPNNPVNKFIDAKLGGR